MDVMDYLPYSGFMQNDEETIAIMTKAATIVPKACDILGISLSDSESDDDTAEEPTEDRSPTPLPPALPMTNHEVQLEEPKERAINLAPSEITGASTESRGSGISGYSMNEGASESEVNDGRGPKTITNMNGNERVKRKRCASTPSTIGQSSSANGIAEISSSSVSSGSEDSGALPPKRRRFPSISLPPTSGISQSNMTEQEGNIRRKMLEDLDLFNTQIKQLAVIEKTKNRLLEKMLIISSALKNQGRASPTATSATNSQDNQ